VQKEESDISGTGRVTNHGSKERNFGLVRENRKKSSVNEKGTPRVLKPVLLHLFHWHIVRVLGSADGHLISIENRET
jgi:hypothetical protein